MIAAYANECTWRVTLRTTFLLYRFSCRFASASAFPSLLLLTSFYSSASSFYFVPSFPLPTFVASLCFALLCFSYLSASFTLVCTRLCRLHSGNPRKRAMTIKQCYYVCPNYTTSSFTFSPRRVGIDCGLGPCPSVEARFSLHPLI